MRAAGLILIVGTLALAGLVVAQNGVPGVSSTVPTVRPGEPPAGTIWFGTSYTTPDFAVIGRADSFSLGTKVDMVANFNPPLPPETGWELLIDGSSVSADPTGNHQTAYVQAIELRSEWLLVGRHVVVMRTFDDSTNTTGYDLASGTVTITG
jgi:hypothetical protein